MKVLIAGVSSRALAQSAAAAGFEVISLDFFGDADHPDGTEAYSLVRDFGCAPEMKELARLTGEIAKRADAVVIEAGLENEPAFLDLEIPGKRWFNPADAVRAARDVRLVRDALKDMPVKVPQVIIPGEALPRQGRWLVKDASHSGGTGVRDWDGSSTLRQYEILQEFIPGELASACFAADGRRSILIGVTRQYAGEARLQAPGFAWCGNVAPYGEEDLVDILAQTADRLTRAFGLVGVNGIDFILKAGIPYLLEINPRPGASAELFERLLGINVFALHAAACEGNLPGSIPAPVPGVVWGKGILYAGRDLQVGETGCWTARGIADVPRPGENIPAGAPICTVLAQGLDVEDCWQNVLEKAEAVQAEIDSV